MIEKMSLAACVAAATACLVACGGGGGGSSTSDGASGQPPSATTTSPQVTFAPRAITAQATPADGALGAFTSVSVTGSKDTLYVGVGSSLHAVAIASITGDYLDAMQIHVTFQEPGSLPDGTYTDTVTFELCKDAQCAQQIAGSPFSVPVTLTVSGSAATAAPTQLAPPSTFLTHDVVDAALSKPLNAVVMASTLPSSALQVVDLATGSERTIALSQPPHELALSPDGLRVAVSHDRMISLVDLTQATPVVREVAMPSSIWQMLLADDDVVQAFPMYATGLYTVDLDAGTSESSLLVRPAGKMRARRHPGADRFYTLDGALSPSNLMRVSLAGNVPTDVASSSNVGQHPMCDNLWLDAAGDRIATACGSVFTASADPSQDMLYAGSLPLTVNTSSYYGNLVWLDDSAATGHYALLDAGQCGTLGSTACNTLLRLVDDQTLAGVGAYWMPPVYRDSEYRVQHGLFVFHAPDESLRIIGRLGGAIDATRAYYLQAPVKGANTGSVLSTGHRAAAARRSQ